MSAAACAPSTPTPGAPAPGPDRLFSAAARRVKRRGKRCKSPLRHASRHPPPRRRLRHSRAAELRASCPQLTHGTCTSAIEQQKTEAAAAREKEEAKTRETALLAGEEAARKYREEEDTRAQTCTVPSLRGDSLSAARHALAKAHCRLGKVFEPRKHRRAALVVSTQSIRVGHKLDKGAAVAVKLAPARADLGS